MEKHLDTLYEQTKNCLRISSKNPNKAIEMLKNIQQELKQIKFHLSLQQQDSSIEKRIANLQIIVLNNLACSYNIKGKHKASLFHLELVRELENQLFAHQSKNQRLSSEPQDIYLESWKQNPQILHQVATTHSNICAVYSQIGNHQRALKQIQRAIKYLQSNQVTKKSDALAVFYYNYAIQLEHLSQINQAHKRALKALSLSNTKPEMKQKIEECISVLEEKMKKREKRIGNYLASKYKSPFFENKEVQNGISTNYISSKRHETKQLPKNLSAYTTKLSGSLKKIPKSTQYPSVHIPKRLSGTKRESSLKSHTLIVESRKKVESLYGQKYVIPAKNRFSLIRKKEELSSLLKSIERE